MNRNRRPMTNKTRKGMEKEIKKGQKNLDTSEEQARSDQLDASGAMKQYPKINKSLVDSVAKGMEVKKKKKHSKHSKRTTPGEVDHRESPPAHPHTENERWEKTLDLQSKGKGKSLTAKLQKRNGKGHNGNTKGKK